MATEDGLSKTVDWTKDLLVWGNNKKPRKLSEAEVKAFFLTDEEKKAKKEEEEKKQKEAEKESTLDKKVDAASVVKTEAAGSVDKTLPSPSSRQPSQPAAAETVDKTLPSSSQGVKEEILTPALAAWEEVKKKLENKKRWKRRRRKGRKEKLLALRPLLTGTCPAAPAPAAQRNQATKLEVLLLTKEKQEELQPSHLKVLLTKENLRSAGAMVLLTKQHHVNLLWFQGKKYSPVTWTPKTSWSRETHNRGIWGASSRTMSGIAR